VSLKKRSFSLSGHRTSVALEPAFWVALEALAQRRTLSLSALVAQVDADRADPALPLASALRTENGLSATSTIRKFPAASTCESSPATGVCVPSSSMCLDS
jgi:predicted DNA-binding ribbon-helix-helix protein